MIGIPWSAIEEVLLWHGFFPMLGFPEGIDPMRCMFSYDGKTIEAIRGGVIFAERGIKDREWRDLR